MFISDIHALGPEDGAGPVPHRSLVLGPQRRHACLCRGVRRDNKAQADHGAGGVYSASPHYLNAVHELAATADGAKVVEKMKSMPTDNDMFGKGHIRPDGRMIHDMYLFQVKKPEESKEPWDYYKISATIPADQAFGRSTKASARSSRRADATFSPRMAGRDAHCSLISPLISAIALHRRAARAEEHFRCSSCSASRRRLSSVSYFWG